MHPSASLKTISERPIGLLALLTLGITSLCFSSPVAASFSLELLSGKEPITSLAIGDDLYVRLLGSGPTADLTYRLLDEAGQIVAEVGPIGWTSGPHDPVFLWSRSGVIGCDQGVTLNPLSYRFRDFNEARAVLAARVFTVELTNSFGTVIATAPLPLELLDVPRFYFSDATGCPRSLFDTSEDVYLSALSVRSAHGMNFFVVYQSNQVSEEGFIQETRPEHTQVPHFLSEFLANGDWTTMLWPADSSRRGSYGTILRQVSVFGPPGYRLRPDDRGLGALENHTIDDRNVHGLTIQEVDCPDCDPIWRSTTASLPER